MERLPSKVAVILKVILPAISETIHGESLHDPYHERTIELNRT